MASFAVCLLCPLSAEAGSYTVAYTGGAAPVVTPASAATGSSFSASHQSASAITQGSPGANDASSFTIQANPGAVPITATFTWVPTAGQTQATDPPPACVLVEQTVSARWYTQYAYLGSGSGPTDCGLPGAVITTSMSSGSQPMQSSSADYWQVLSSPGASFSRSCHPSVTFTAQSQPQGYVSGTAEISCGASAYPVTLSLGGTTLVSGVPEALTGQPITASLSALPPNCTASGYHWGIKSQNGTSIVGGYIAQQALGMTISISSITNPTVTFCDGIQDTATVNLSVTITFSDKTTATTTLTTHLLFVKPTVTSHSFGVSHYDTFTQHPNDTDSLLGAIENWSNVVIGMPTGFTGGTGCFTQTLQSTSRVDTRHTGTDYTIQNKLSNGQWVAIPAPCLDTDFPYPYANSWTVGASGMGGQGMGGDQPSFTVAPALNSGDLGMVDWYST